MTDNNEFYVVAWASYDDDNDSMSGGFLGGLYSTKKGAKDAIMDAVVEDVETAMASYGDDEIKDEFGSEDPAEVAPKFIEGDTENWSKTVIGNTETQYFIRKFTSANIK